MPRSIRGLLLAALMVMSLVAVPAAAQDGPPAQPAKGEVQRLSGPTRIETAAEISRSTFAPDVPVAFIATGSRFPDAMTGGPLAASIGAPILLADVDVVPAATRSELRRLRPKRIVILGGTQVIGAATAEALAEFTTEAGVERISGGNRFETAAAIAREAFTQPVPIVFIASGLDFPDALSGAAAGAEMGGPVLLTAPNDLPGPTRAALSELNPQRIVVLGGTAAVGQGVQNELAFYTDAEVERWAGTDRYETSMEIARQAFSADASAAFIATGANFPDALTGAAAAGARRSPLLLTSRFSVPQRLHTELERLSPGGLDVYVLGGDAVISPQVHDAVGAYANPTLSSITVTVTDATSSAPVARAELTLRRGDETWSATSGHQGQYTFEDVVWGDLKLKASALGYAPSETRIDLEPGEDRDVALTVDRVAAITGRVVIAGTDEQVPGAQVTAQRRVEGTPVGPVFAVDADDDGNFLISDTGGLTPGDYRVRASADGFDSFAKDVTVEAGAWADAVRLELVRDD